MSTKVKWWGGEYEGTLNDVDFLFLEWRKKDKNDENFSLAADEAAVKDKNKEGERQAIIILGI